MAYPGMSFVSLSVQEISCSYLSGPSAPPVEEIYAQPVKSKSVGNMVSLAGKPSKRMSRRASRQASLEIPQANMPAMPGKVIEPYAYAKSMPASPIGNPPRQDIILSSAHSSSTSVASGNMTPKSMAVLGNRPPSAYYARDFLTSLAPREGGYAIAAQMSTPPLISAEEKRRSVQEDMRSRPTSRAPLAKSAGMGRWSLDGGEVSPE